MWDKEYNHLRVGRFAFSIYNQWRDLFGKMHWYDFTFINLTIENEYPNEINSWEFYIGFMGINLQIEWRPKW